MRRWSIARTLPGLMVVALLCVAAAGPNTPLMPAPPPLFSYCAQPSLAGGGASTTTLDGSGVTQPLPSGITVAACSLRAEANGWTYSTMRVWEWDPLTLAPDPTAIALRSENFNPSRMNYYTTNSVPAVQFVPPIVTRSLSGVAEPPRQTIAIEVQGGSSIAAFYDAASSSVMPAAGLVALDGTRSPLPGAHPVIAHALCTGNADVQQLRIAQSVRRADATLAAGTMEVVQRFTVPEAVELRWIEFGLVSGPGQQPANAGLMPEPFPVVGVLDGATLGAPTIIMPPTLVEAAVASFYYFTPGPRWVSPGDFDHVIILQPGHDYWLYLRNAQAIVACARIVGASESANFGAGVGPLYTRLLANDAWSELPSRALTFTIVGRPTAGLGAGAPLLGNDGIRMQISPNPARDLAEVRWSGGVGPVRLEVLDARGRRVATGEGGAAGTWSLSRAAHSGTPLPSGVYFVHARDSAGGHAVERMVIVR